MVNNSERREVAARLRSIAGEYVTLGMLETALGMDITSPDVDIDKDAKNINRLADLIDRPTCKPAIPNEMEGYVFCSQCGAEIGEYGVPNYCYNCGAELVKAVGE